MAKGIVERHARSCRSRNGGRCDCEPTFQANVWDGQAQERVRKTFDTLTGAQMWRRDALIALRRGRPISTGSPKTLREASESWLDGARQGAIRTRSGDKYKPSAVRSYDRSMRLRVLDKLGDEPLEDIRRGDLQELVEQLIGAGLAASTIQATIIPLRAIFRREVALERIQVNPTSGLQVPAIRGGRDRIASPDEAAKLLDALPVEDRAVWATGMYGGLRRGELKALRDDAVDLAAGGIHVVAGWDDKEGEIETKGRRRRRVPIPAVLRDQLLEQRMRTGRTGRDLVFGSTPTSPFRPGLLTARADTAWATAKLDRITLHQCRHTFASLMIAAGVNAKALSTYMGHSSITVTYDRYGHLMPGNEDEAAGLLDAYLVRANTAARVAQLG
jgi:integrase